MKRNGAFVQNLVYFALALLVFSQDVLGQEAELEHSAGPPADVSVSPGKSPHSKLPDFNEDIYYKNKLEFSLETGYLPLNIPFVYNFLTGDSYTKWPLSYTLVPNF